MLILRLLNEQTQATAGWLERRSGFSRGTVYRLLETLVRAGYVRRLPGGRGYVPTARVAILGGGFRDETWPEEAAAPILAEAAEAIEWPLALATIYGGDIMVRAATESPYVLNPIKPGFRMPALETAAGWAMLASLPEPQQSGTIRALRIQDRARGRPSISDPILQRQIAAAKGGGFAMRDHRSHTILAVSVRDAYNAPFASLAIRFFSKALTVNKALDRYLPRLHSLAGAVSRARRTLPVRNAVG